MEFGASELTWARDSLVRFPGAERVARTPAGGDGVDGAACVRWRRAGGRAGGWAAGGGWGGGAGGWAGGRAAVRARVCAGRGARGAGEGARGEGRGARGRGVLLLCRVVRVVGWTCHLTSAAV